MSNFAEFQELIKKKGLGYSQPTYINGTPVYLSRGIREVFYETPELEQTLLQAISRFQKDDLGNSAEYGKDSKPGHEYGRYEVSVFDESSEDTAIWVHRAEDAIKVYFRFER